MVTIVEPKIEDFEAGAIFVGNVNSQGVQKVTSADGGEDKGPAAQRPAAKKSRRPRARGGGG